MIITGVITVLTVAAMMVSTSALFVAGLVGAILLILTGGVSEKEAFVSADIKLLILIASFGVISKSISNTGGGRLIANGFAKPVGENASPVMACALLFIVTAALTWFQSDIVVIVVASPISPWCGCSGSEHCDKQDNSKR